MSLQDTVKNINEALFQPIDPISLFTSLKELRNLCARGPQNQKTIVQNEALTGLLKRILFTDDYEDQLKIITWQLLANTIVNNKETQKLVWINYRQEILQNFLITALGPNTNVQLMIIYNILKSKMNLIDDQEGLHVAVLVWQKIHDEKCTLEFDFLHFIFEYFLVENGRIIVKCYENLDGNDRLTFLDYMANYLQQGSPNGSIHTFFLQHISKAFKMKSDCILRATNDSQTINNHPREVHSLLRILASASGNEYYANIFATDYALFLNVSSLLRCLVAAGKESQKNIFTPMNKLEEVAVSSKVSTEFEGEISFELKTLLVRCVANLLYKNPTNQGYCLDTELIPTLLECTNMDARNPLIKEWSILAIRNACIGCPEIQSLIANMTKEGEAPNDLLNELNLDLGALRISTNK